MKNIKVHPFALQEIFNLLENGYHVVDSYDNEDCFTVFLNNNNDIVRFFDFEYIKED